MYSAVSTTTADVGAEQKRLARRSSPSLKAPIITIGGESIIEQKYALEYPDFLKVASTAFRLEIFFTFSLKIKNCSKPGIMANCIVVDNTSPLYFCVQPFQRPMTQADAAKVFADPLLMDDPVTERLNDIINKKMNNYRGSAKMIVSVLYRVSL